MKVILSMAIVLGLSALASAADKDDAKPTGPLSFKMKGIDDKDVDLSQYKGKVVLLVNVASKCGYTPQYEGMQKLYEKYNKDGFVIIGVPANDFGKQEPGANAEILKFCESKYKVTFPLLAKVVVKGEGQCDLYKYLTSKETNPKFGGEVGWNFEKFLIGKNGEVVNRFKSSVDPVSETLENAVKKELAAK